MSEDREVMVVNGERLVGRRIRRKKRFKLIRKVLTNVKLSEILTIALGVIIGDLVFEGLKALVHLI